MVNVCLSRNPTVLSRAGTGLEGRTELAGIDQMLLRIDDAATIHIWSPWPRSQSARAVEKQKSPTVPRSETICTLVLYWEK